MTPLERMYRFALFFLVGCWLHSFNFVSCNRAFGEDAAEKYKGKVIKGNRNALFLVESGARRQFPDFFTFDKMGFNVSGIRKIKDDVLNSIPLGPQIKALPAPPPFRPDDYAFHEECGDYDRMINDLGLIPNMGHFYRYHNIITRARKTGKLSILALGGSITAGGYFIDFVRLLQEKHNLTVTVYNHGHGATEITYTLFCVDVDRHTPDLVCDHHILSYSVTSSYTPYHDISYPTHNVSHPPTYPHSPLSRTLSICQSVSLSY